MVWLANNNNNNNNNNDDDDDDDDDDCYYYYYQYHHFFYFLRETRTHFKNDIPGKRNSLDDEVNKLRLDELVSSALDVTACFLHHVSSVQRTYHHPYIPSPMECSI